MGGEGTTGYEVELGYPLSDSYLGTVLDGSSLEITFVRGVPVDDAPVPYFVARGSGVDAVDELLERHEEVRSFESVVDSPHGRLYRVEWGLEDGGIVSTIRDCGGIVRRMSGTEDGWTLVVYFPTNEQTAAFHDACIDRGLGIDIRRAEPAHLDEGSFPGRGLSEKQLEAVRLAFERGYFETPKETTLAAIAADLGLSEQALSQRLRRATRSVVQSLVEEMAADVGRGHRK